MTYFGAAYYPEHWPEERWARDAELMRAACFNVVRLGEFAWCRMEPAEDQFTFDWLDRAIETLAAQGIGVLLGTPTAGPPAWLVNAARPAADCRQLHEDGVRMEFGARSLLCVNHPRHRERAGAIAGAMGRRYADRAAVIGFQIDNEIGMFGHRCYCDECQRQFRGWLTRRYGGIETLNERLGMVFGGGEFRSFEDVPLPRLRQDLHGPGLLLDSERFFSESNAAFVADQARAIRAAGAPQPITTNVCHMFHGADLDGEKLFAPLDVAGWDCYPSQFGTPPKPETMALLHGVARAYKGGRRHWMLEQQSGSPMEAVADDPRASRLWTWQSLAHGAAMILYFRWRTCRYGGEQYWRGILDHDGEPNQRYETVAATGAEVALLAPLLARLERPRQVAIVMDHDSCASLSLSRPGAGVDYRDTAQRWWAAAACAGWDADVVFPTDDLAPYRVVIAPLPRLMDAALAQRLRAFVAAGGTLIAGPLAATLDRDHVAPPAGHRPPHPLQDLFGVERVEWSSLAATAKPPKERLGEAAAAWQGLNDIGEVPVEGTKALGGVYTCRHWCDHLAPRAPAPEVWARFAPGGPAAGRPAVTVHATGAGRAVYVAGLVDQRLQTDLLRALLPTPDAGVTPVDEEGGLEVVRCVDPADGTTVVFVLNHADQERQVVLSGDGWTEALADAPCGPEAVIGPYGVLVLRGRTERPA